MHFLGWANVPGIKFSGKLEPVDRTQALAQTPRDLLLPSGNQLLPHPCNLLSVLSSPSLRWRCRGLAGPAAQACPLLSLSQTPSLLKPPRPLLGGGMKLSGPAIGQLCAIMGNT